jgi:murein DD-endopeptidase MepM/ murein hydrolase activator NlpD
MRDRLIVTISDTRGTKSFNVHKVIKKVLLYTVLSILLIVIVGGSFILFLQKELVSLEDRKDEIVKEYEDLLVDNEVLTQQITQKNEDLDIISGKINNIEELIGLKFNKKMTVNEKVNLAELSTIERVKILRQIPSGYPVEDKGISSKFGKRIHPILKKQEFHTGIDLKAKMNTPVLAPADGVVEYGMRHKKSGYGKLIIIAHNFGFKTLYGHLNKIDRKVGEVVRKGDIIGYTGNTGLSSGPHLHYEIKYINMPLNPENFMTWNLKNYDNLFNKEKKVKWQSLINLTKLQHQEQQLLQKEQN